MEAAIQAARALSPPARAELLHVLLLPDLERVERIGGFWSYPQSRTVAELLIDCEEEDRTLRAVLVGMRISIGGRGKEQSCIRTNSWLGGSSTLPTRATSKPSKPSTRTIA